MAEIRNFGVSVRYELTPLGEKLAREGKVAFPVRVTPELEKKRAAAVADAKKKSHANKRKRIEAGNFKKLPPMDAKERKRLELLEQRRKAHEKAAAEAEEDHEASREAVLAAHSRIDETAEKETIKLEDVDFGAPAVEFDEPAITGDENAGPGRLYSPPVDSSDDDSEA